MLYALLPYLTLVVVLVVSVVVTILNPLYLYLEYGKAKATGLQFVVVPSYIYNFITSKVFRCTILQPLNKILPEPSEASWPHLSTLIWPLELNHTLFEALGTDNFFTVAPGDIIFNTADASVMSQILAQGSAFPKAVQIYISIALYSVRGEWYVCTRFILLSTHGFRFLKFLGRVYESSDSTDSLTSIFQLFWDNSIHSKVSEKMFHDPIIAFSSDVHSCIIRRSVLETPPKTHQSRL
jgi:hypothetical protein